MEKYKPNRSRLENVPEPSDTDESKNLTMADLEMLRQYELERINVILKELERFMENSRKLEKDGKNLRDGLITVVKNFIQKMRKHEDDKDEEGK